MSGVIIVFFVLQIQETRFCFVASPHNTTFAAMCFANRSALVFRVANTRNAFLRCAHMTNAFVVSETQETHAARNECVDIALNAFMAILAYIGDPSSKTRKTRRTRTKTRSKTHSRTRLDLISSTHEKK
jgi:hypothetical protein